MDDERKQFIENIQKWVAMDSQLKTIHEKVKRARESKHHILSNICQYVEKQALTNSTIEISDGELRFYDKREYKPISFGYIEECLETLLKDPTQVETIMTYLHEHREVKTTKDIRRYYHEK